MSRPAPAAQSSVQAMFAEALQHHNAGRLPQAEGLYRRILARHPRHAESLHLLGLMACQVDRHADGAELIAEAIRLREDDPVAHNNLGNALHKLGRCSQALIHFRRSIALRPDVAEVHNNLGNTLKDLGKHAEAVTHYRHAITLKPGVAEVHNNLGNTLKDLGSHIEAVAHYRQALALKPGVADVHHNLGNSLKDLGQLAEAIAHYRRAVALKPTSGLYHRHLAAMGRISGQDEHLAAMEALARDIESLSIDDQRELHFALGKAYEDLKDFERSFRHLLAANRIRRNQIAYDETVIVGEFSHIRTAFTPELIRSLAGTGDRSASPIFIVGMPRSGTTLVEQILSSHPAVFGAGELEAFEQAVCSLEGDQPGTGYPRMVPDLSAVTLGRLGRRYIAGTRNRAPDAQRVVDKMPGNFRFVGLIHLALPNARIIHLRRNPIDTCVSCFALQFQAGHHYSYDLGELGRYYRGYESLMQHWRETLPAGAMLEVQYEDVVADLEQQARRIVAYCGLEWDDACLAFYKTQRPVMTASALQVRQPIYRSSVGRWRAYGDLLQPLLDTLGVRPA